jgi:hypothetical protein
MTSTLREFRLVVTPTLERPYVAEEYEDWQARFAAQPMLLRRFLAAQGRQLAEALVQGRSPASFVLPDHVVSAGPAAASLAVPGELREQHVGSMLERLTRADLGPAIRLRLQELEHSPHAAVALAAGLIRHATVWHMVHALLPDGRPVTYETAEGDEIPTLPGDNGPGSALVAARDAIAEEEDAPVDRGELQAPYVPAARRFFLPQWVVCDEMDRLLVNSLEEGEAHLAAMQQFMAVLHAAVSLAPYFVADTEYQRKRYGMLGQLINQGRAFARYETGEMIRIVQQRAWAHDLNRGLSLSVPYFDDQRLELRTRDFTVIPAGRIMFIPALVVRAAREEQAKVAQDTRLNGSTRRNLLIQLRIIERAFARVPQGWRAPAVKTR